MPIQFRCPHCKSKISISRKQSGEELDCPSCAELVNVPVIGSGKPDQTKKDEKTPEFEESETIEEKASDLFPDEFFGEQGSETESEQLDDMDLGLDDPFDEPVAEENEPDRDSDDDGGKISSGNYDEEEEEFGLRRAETEFDELDLTPMVDVTFLLLIFFMISASFSLQKTMQFPPPEPNEDGATHSMQQMEELEKDSIEIEVTEDNLILVDEVPVDDPALLAEIIADKATANQQQEILLTAHEQALHDTVVWVFDSANTAGIQAIRIMTSSE